MTPLLPEGDADVFLDCFSTHQPQLLPIFDRTATTRDGFKVEAQHAVIATNGYTSDLWPSLRQSIITANSFVIATDPLDEAVGGQILKGKEVVSDSRRLLLYFRRDAQGRFIIGGRGRFQEPRTAADWSHLERSVGLLFPQLKNTPFPYKWAGRVAITRDAIPHVHQPAPNLHIALGYNGRGVALATQMGCYLANAICKGESMPFPITAVKPIPLHGMRRLYVAMGIAYFGLCDRLS